jgi:predicted secreted protein
MPYTSSSAKASIGTTFTWNSVNPTEIISITGPRVTGRKIEVTNFNSGNYAEYLMGVLDTGTLNITMNYIAADAGQIGMLSDAASRTSRTWAIDFPTVGNFSGSGYIESFETNADVGGQVKLTITITVTGTVTTGST